MEFGTKGIKIYQDYTMPVHCVPDETFKTADSATKLFKLIYIEKGSGTACLNSYQSFFIAPMLYCLNENDSFECLESTGLKARSFYFLPSLINYQLSFDNLRSIPDGTPTTLSQDRFFLQSFIQRNETYQGQLYAGFNSGIRLTELFDRLSDILLCQNTDFWPCLSRSYFIELLFLVQQLFITPQQDNPLNETGLKKHPDNSGSIPMDDLILYIHNHYQDKITIDDLTRKYCTNRTTLNKKFLDYTGQSVISYLIQLRIKLAAAMLRDTTLPVQTIMSRVGFNDTTHFTRLFKKQTKHTPTDYRTRFNWIHG